MLQELIIQIDHEKQVYNARWLRLERMTDAKESQQAAKDEPLHDLDDYRQELALAQFRRLPPMNNDKTYEIWSRNI